MKTNKIDLQVAKDTYMGKVVYQYFGEQDETERRKNRKAIVIGIMDKNPRSAVKKSCRHSAQRMAQLLGQQFDVTLIDDDKTWQMPEFKETDSQEYRKRREKQIYAIRNTEFSKRTSDAVEQMFKQSNSNDSLIIYYSGHGIESGDGSGVCLLFGQGDQYEVKNILERAQTARYKSLILILDCCYSGSIGNMKGGLFDQLPMNMCILTAGKQHTEVMGVSKEVYYPTLQSSWRLRDQKKEDSVDIEKLKQRNDRQRMEQQKSGEYIDYEGEERPKYQGYTEFSNYLIEAICGGAASPLGIVTISSIYQYVSEAMGSNNDGMVKRTNGTFNTDHGRPMMKSNLECNVPICYVTGLLSNNDLKVLVDFRKSLKDYKIELPPSTDKDYMEKLKQRNENARIAQPFVKGAQAEASLLKFKKLGLVNLKGKSVQTNSETGKTELVDIYTLTPRGWHYWELLEHVTE